MSDKNAKEEQKDSTAKTKKVPTALDEFGNHMEKFAVRTAESLRKVIDRTLSSRNTVLTIRVSDDANKKMNMLVEAGLFRSRSECAAYLIMAGIQSQNELFSKVENKFEKIEKLREELKNLVSDQIKLDTSV